MTFEKWDLKAIFHFTKSFLTRNILSPSRHISVAGTLLRPPRHSLFFWFPFSKSGTKGCSPSRKKSADTVQTDRYICMYISFIHTQMRIHTFLKFYHLSKKMFRMSWHELEKFWKLSGCANIIFLRELLVTLHIYICKKY